MAYSTKMAASAERNRSCLTALLLLFLSQLLADLMDLLFQLGKVGL